MAERPQLELDIKNKSAADVDIQQFQEATKVIESLTLAETEEDIGEGASDEADDDYEEHEDPIAERNLLDLIGNGDSLLGQEDHNTRQTETNCLLLEQMSSEIAASNEGYSSQIAESSAPSKLLVSLPLPNSPSGINTKESLALPEKQLSALETVIANVEPCVKLSPDDNASTLNASGGSSTNSAVPSPQREFHVKWVKFKDETVPVITQNKNGPCPLIAIMNVLLFRGKIQLPNGTETIKTEDLIYYIADCFLEYTPRGMSEADQLNYNKNVQDAIEIINNLTTGLDVNVRFTGVKDFEYTRECLIFDLLNISLCHGWLVDPELTEVTPVIGNLTYNQLVMKTFTNSTSSATELTEAYIVKTFLQQSASQLTYHGLYELNRAIHPDELCVLFRNNHFSTIYKRDDCLYQLVSDQGFLAETNVVWITFDNIDGDADFVDSNFNLVPPKLQASLHLADENIAVSSEQQVDQDYLVALSMQEEQHQVQEREKAWEEFKVKNLGLNENLTDEELARRLQEQEEQRAAAAQQQPSGGAAAAAPERPPVAQQPRPSKNKKSDCVIL